MPYPWKTVIDHKKLNFLGPLCNLPCSYVRLNVSSTSGSHISKTWTTRALVSSLILTEYWPSMLYTMYLIDIYQMECFPLSVQGKESFMKRLSNEVTLIFFINVSTFHLRSIDIAFWWCELYMDYDQTLPGIVVYLQKDNEDNWSCCYAKIQEHMLTLLSR